MVGQHASKDHVLQGWEEQPIRVLLFLYIKEGLCVEALEKIKSAEEQNERKRTLTSRTVRSRSQLKTIVAKKRDELKRFSSVPWLNENWTLAEES